MIDTPHEQPPQSPISSAPRPHALAFIFVTVLIDVMGLGIIIPILPKLVMELTGLPVNEAAAWGGWLGFAYAITQFICGPILGNLSDRFGRRPVLLASLTAFGIDYVFMGLAPQLWWLFLGRVIAGVAGASPAPASAYIADITPPEKRAQSFGLLGAAFGIGFILGPAIGGLMGHYFGIRAPFFTAAALALANATYGYLVLPESLPPERRRQFSLRRANVLGTFAQMRRIPGIPVLLSAMFAWQLGHMALQSTWSYYTMFRFGWSELGVGASLAAVGLMGAFVQGVLTRSLIPRWGEARAALIGFVMGCAGYVAFAFASSGWMMYAAIVVYCLAGLVHPSLNAKMSKRIATDAQGELQGAVASTYGLCAVIGPPLMTHIFQYFSRPDAIVHVPGAAFLLAAALGMLACGLFLRALGRLPAASAPSL